VLVRCIESLVVVSTSKGEKISRLGTRQWAAGWGSTEGCEKVVGMWAPMTLPTFPFCICGERWPEPYLWLLKGVTTALVGGTAVSARIDPPSTEELDNARYASSIPRSLVGHTKACTYCDELRRRRFTMLRGGESENERLHVWCGRAPSIEM
jgi:hypothetical protein